jgi:hypothetical protein
VAAVNVTFAEGLTSQTWSQLMGVVMEMRFLEERFVAGGLPLPRAKTFGQAWQRAVKAYLESLAKSGDVALETVQRYRDSSCPRTDSSAISLAQEQRQIVHDEAEVASVRIAALRSEVTELKDFLLKEKDSATSVQSKNREKTAHDEKQTEITVLTEMTNKIVSSEAKRLDEIVEFQAGQADKGLKQMQEFQSTQMDKFMVLTEMTKKQTEKIENQDKELKEELLTRQADDARGLKQIVLVFLTLLLIVFVLSTLKRP